MKGGLATVMLVVLVGLPAVAAPPRDAVPGEMFAGTLGSLVGLAGGFLGGRALAVALGFDSQPGPKDLVTVTCVALGVTAGASLGVTGVGSTLGVDGNALGCAGGAFLGLVAGMAVEPLLGLLFSPGREAGSALLETLGPVVEAVGFLSAVVLPAVGATVGFNLGATARSPHD
jgi:hypothetical protein